MPKNPARRICGGDVEGTEKVDGGVQSLCEPISVASASYDAGYMDFMEESLSAGYMTMADLKRGYSSYGQGIGEGKKDWRRS